MEKNVVGWFEIPVKDMPRSKKFYSAVFGHELIDMNMPDMEMAAFPWVNDAPHAGGGLVKSKDYEPSATGAVVYFYCEDANVELVKAVKSGGKVLVPKTSIGEFGFIALFLDSEGNRIGLHSSK
jgi:predicted enzyme related to lactoylglutathione lyase